MRIRAPTIARTIRERGPIANEFMAIIVKTTEQPSGLPGLALVLAPLGISAVATAGVAERRVAGSRLAPGRAATKVDPMDALKSE